MVLNTCTKILYLKTDSETEKVIVSKSLRYEENVKLEITNCT
jgi:Holliday junction resolvase RusA-like endonuclease